MLLIKHFLAPPPQNNVLRAIVHTVQMDNDSKHIAKATQQFIKTKKGDILQLPTQSSDLSPLAHTFQLLNKN